MIDSVKSVDNANIVTLNLKQEVKYEELCGMKKILAAHHGDDPVIIKLPMVDGYSAKILAAPIFWVKSSNDLVQHMKQFFPNQVELSIHSLDKPLDI